MWPDLRGSDRGLPPRMNPFIPPVDAPQLQVTIDHLLSGGFSDEYQYLLELMALDQFVLVRRVGAFPDLDGLEFEFGPLDDYPSDVSESCRVLRSHQKTGSIRVPRASWDTAHLRGEAAPERTSAAARETRAAILASLSVRLGSHILVSERVDFRPPADYVHSNHCTIQESLAILGLHMRTHGSHVVVNRSGLKLHVERSNAEILEAARLLPALHAIANDDRTDARVAGLAEACLERMTRLLRARDNVLIAQTMSGPSSWVDPCVDTEAAAVAFTAALDALARLINVELSWDLPPIKCGLHKKIFSRRLSASLELPQQKVAISRAQNLASAVSEVRNTLHAEPLGRAYLRCDGRGPTSIVRIHNEVAPSIAKQCRELGIYDRWLMDVDDGSLLLNPFTFVNDLAIALSAIADPIVTWLRGKGDLAGAEPSDQADTWTASHVERNARLYGLWLWAADPTPFSLDGSFDRGPSSFRTVQDLTDEAPEPDVR